MAASVEDRNDGMGIRLLHVRQLVGYSHEAAGFLAGSRARYPEIDSFVQSLGREALREYDRMFTALAPVEEMGDASAARDVPLPGDAGREPRRGRP
jgi:hypothetical protein